MCGILGICTVDKKVDFERFRESLEYIKHRGPDYDCSKQIDPNTLFGHTRLSIIDLSSANNQPFSIDDRYVLTYNGEIYNYIELKKELEKSNIQFKTKGDTEVVLRAYLYWGEDCVQKFNGMWAFAIYDKVLKKLFCSRDRFGIKPFVYYHNPNEIIFSSEIKPIIHYKPDVKKPNYNLIANYCYKSLGAQTKETWFKNIIRLLPAHNLVWKNGQLKTYPYWTYPKKIDSTLSFQEAVKKFETLFVDAVKIRMRSDVEVGSTLSSGLDSSTIVGVLNKNGFKDFETFTAYSKSEQFAKNDKLVYQKNIDLDESKIVRRLTKDFKVKPNYIEVSFSNYIDKLSEAIYYLESGHSSPAIIPIHQIYKDAKKKIKVLMEGQGADELLAGYVLDVLSYYFLKQVKKGKLKEIIKNYLKFKKIYTFKLLILLCFRLMDSRYLNSFKNLVKKINIFNKHLFLFTYIKDNALKKEHFDDSINSRLWRSHVSGLVNLLHYGDALSMSESLECRLPFMDYRLVEFAFTLPYHYKIQALKGKFIQREAFKNYIPEYITKSLVKIGFATPLDNLINSDEKIKKILIENNYQNFFNTKNIQNLLERNKKSQGNYTTILFRILSAKLWFKIFFQENWPKKSFLKFNKKL